MNMVYLAAVLLASILAPPLGCSGAWNDPTNNQYHIQTDEGPERYFKYQTQNGQYRKEKRLQDGTVIGSYAWIDDDGFLRQRDYIADSQGYRIVKNKNIYVGRNVNVGDAVKATKNIPNNYGGPLKLNPVQQVPIGYLGITPKPVYSIGSTSPSVEVSLNSVQSSTSAPSSLDITPSSLYLPSSAIGLNDIGGRFGPLIPSSPSSVILPPSTPNPLPYLHLPAESPSNEYIPPRLPVTTYLPSTTSPKPPTIYIPSQNNLNIHSPTSTTPSPVSYSPPVSSSTYIPPSSSYIPSSTSRPLLPTYAHTNAYFATSTVSPISHIPNSSPRPFASPTYSPHSSVPSNFPSSTPEYLAITPPARKYIPQSQNVNPNSLEYSGSPQYEHYPEDFINPYIHQNGPTYPIDKRGHSFNPTYNNIGNGYDPQYPYYDGISVTNDGFRYYIPKAYHEEQNVDQDRKTGSFGYVDPFGIRRVIYYNAGPDGFKHRKNNRYVGFNGTPYDPRPY